MPDWLETLAAAEEDSERAQFLAAHAASLPVDAPARFHAAVLAAVYNDRPRALRLSLAARELAGIRADELSRAWAARCQGHCDYVAGDYEKAVAEYEQASLLFESAGAEAELGRTLLGALQSLIFRGEYERAHQWAARAETIFHRHQDLLRLARLDSNVGNIYFRQDRPRDALARYLRALEGFEVAGEPRDIAAALSNLAVSSTNLGQFAEALAYYQRAREHCLRHGMENLVARADYNIAYLFHLRGDYTEARRLYQIARQRAEATEDAYHTTLCDLDEAEMYLELNLTREGELMARRAEQGFDRLGMPYEQAKALVHMAVAASQRRDYRSADRTLIRARRLFLREKNPVWPALVDQLRAVLAFHGLRFEQARRLSTSAWRALTRTMVPGRAAHCQILLARLWLRAGYADRARALSHEAVERVGSDVSPSLRFHANLVQGEIHEMQGRWTQALESYEAARRDVEDLRARVDSEDLRISILQDKLAVYEGLVALCLDSPAGGGPAGAARALLLVEQAKSRSLADRLASPAADAWLEEDDAPLAALRRDLNLVYRQINLAALSDPASPVQAGTLRERARELETRLMKSKPRPASSPGIRPGAPADLSALQNVLHEGELLLEYYEARGVLYVFLLSRHSLEAVRLGSSIPVLQALKLLQFQMGKFRWSKELSPTHRTDFQAASHHLRELYQLLVAPLEDRIARFGHLIVAPHRDLHGLPFAALHDGEFALVDRFTLSVAPSAGVLARCRGRSARGAGGSVVMAVPDPKAPRIEEEAHLVAIAIPGARLLIGPEASIEAFHRYAPEARILHLAAHGVFRRDNPLFSSLQLADGHLSLLDLNRIRLNVDLLTLSACSTGLTVSVGGDELLGLIRGCLEAGARSLLVTLWEIDDACTNEFMRSFYRGVREGSSLAGSLRTAMHEIREQYPNPYFWAPFLLVGEHSAIALPGTV